MNMGVDTGAPHDWREFLASSYLRLSFFFFKQHTHTYTHTHTHTVWTQSCFPQT